MAFKTNSIYSKKPYGNNVDRRDNLKLIVLIYSAKTFKLIRKMRGIKDVGDKYKVSNIAYVINKNKGKDLSDCVVVDNRIFKVEEKAIF
jgi:hypothetical protein